MSASPARVEANQRNALRSTGPRTPEGKDASRRNSLKHCLTGGGIVVPDQDLERISRIAGEIRLKYQPTDPVGLAMAEHAATLIVRLDRCGRHEVALIADQVAAARYDFDQARRDWADELFDGLQGHPASVDELLRFPEGIDRLIEGWSGLMSLDEWLDDDRAMAAILSNSGFDDESDLRATIPGRITRLETARAAIDRRPIDRARQQAADLALFGMSPEAILARRYEAATVRALEKAKTYLERCQATVSIPEVTETPETSDPATPLGSLLPDPPPRSLVEIPTQANHPVTVAVAPAYQASDEKRIDPEVLRAQMNRNSG